MQDDVLCVGTLRKENTSTLSALLLSLAREGPSSAASGEGETHAVCQPKDLSPVRPLSTRPTSILHDTRKLDAEDRTRLGWDGVLSEEGSYEMTRRQVRFE